MSETAVVLTLKKDRAIAKAEGTRVAFSPHLCFAFEDDPEEINCLRALGGHLQTLPGLALIGPQHFIDYLFRHAPALRSSVAHITVTPDMRQRPIARPAKALAELPPSVATAFICEPMAFPRMELRRMLPRGIEAADLTLLAEITPDAAPGRAWVPMPKNIYPINIPGTELREGLDLVLLDCPSRNLALMPNGLAYVNNALKKTSVSFQIFDLDIIAYHRFHIHRLYDMGGRITLPSGRVLPEDPWQAEHYDVWSSGAETATKRGGNNEVLDFFRPLIDEAANSVIEARPKILGLSIQQCNEAISREIVNTVKKSIPDTVILVGGFSCYNPDIGRRAFPESDYMCIGESDLTVGPLVEALARGERPANQAGILSRHDTPDYTFIPAPMVHNLDQIEFPKYEWCDLNVYRNYNDYQLVPIIASRGCRWSRCTFCAERFYWRIRSPQNFVDELEWLVNQGCHLYMFNESDLNGMPERVMEICDEIIRRGLHKKVKLTGQLRIHKKSNRAFFEKLREANFVALRFGVDAFSQNTLRLQKKGYTVEMVSQNLKDCWEVGIYTEVNWVIGIPGETDQDVEEGIQLILKNRNYIGRLANINPLILVNGGVYWIDPEAHNIVFKEPKDQLYAKFPRALPADSWYSTEPYIDAQVRKERFERIVVALHDAGFPVGAWANRVIEDVKLARDPNRAAAKKPQAVTTAAERQEESPEETIPQPEQIANKLQNLGKVIPIRAAGESDNSGGKPLAEPPLFGTAGVPPRLVRKLETHDVVFYDGWYHGIPHALGEVDLTSSDLSKLAGVVKHATEEGVIEIIEEASRWANTRGQYDAQEKQRSAGTYMRAGSALGETRIEKVPEKPKVVRFETEYVAISRGTLKAAFETQLFSSPGPSEAQPSIAIEARSPLRRLASKLPPWMQHEIRRIVRLRAFEQGMTGAPLKAQSDGRLVGMLWRGLFDTYVRRPFRRILRGEQRASSRSEEGTQVSGEDFTIISILTKNALPELMWTIGRYNLVKFDGTFYGLPHGLPIDWVADNIASLPGVFVGKTIKQVVAMIEGAQQTEIVSVVGQAQASKATGPAGVASRTPVLLGALEGYNIVSYEGWIYGIPQNIGQIDLTEVDAMAMPGVIRDVSRDVVENEILDRTHVNKQATA
jgi:radical SAM superfamily enzyme YgiQ (UPF0313 family)